MARPKGDERETTKTTTTTIGEWWRRRSRGKIFAVVDVVDVIAVYLVRGKRSMREVEMYDR